jgi:TRAP-type mannitol/chloroaromatic compound transport system permease large subunit
MQTSFMHPPFGFALFYLRSVAPKAVRTTDIYWGAIPFVLIQLVMVALVLTFPGLVGGHVEKVDGGMMEIQLDTASDSYLRPPGVAP